MNKWAELIEEYRDSYEKLRCRHEKLTAERILYDKRVALLEEEMDELQEVMRMMRPYAEKP